MRVAALKWVSEADSQRQDGVGDDAERGTGNGEEGRVVGSSNKSAGRRCFW